MSSDRLFAASSNICIHGRCGTLMGVGHAMLDGKKSMNAVHYYFPCITIKFYFTSI